MQECKPGVYKVNKQNGDGCAVGNLYRVVHAAVLLTVVAAFKLGEAAVTFTAFRPSRLKQLPCWQPSAQARPGEDFF